MNTNRLLIYFLPKKPTGVIYQTYAPGLIVEIGKWKGKENSIFLEITGKTVDDISHLEDHLLEYFLLFSAEFKLERVKLRRKTFLNMNYVLFHLLKQLGHKVDENNFSLIKTEKARKEHDAIIEKIFKKLEWN